MAVEFPTRLCIVKNEVGYFHAWEHYSKPLPASPLVGGEPAGMFQKIFGIVDFKDGVQRVDPTDIIFRDEDNDALYRIDEDSKKRIIKGPSAKGENT